MAKYVLDTNLYIHAERDLQWKNSLYAFARRNLPFLHLHSVVANELLAGAISPPLKRVTRALIEPFESTGRVVTPAHSAWKRAGEIVAALVGSRVLSPNGIPRSFLNDCVVAASVREAGVTLVTDNARDFEMIRTVLAFDFVQPWP